MAETTLYIYIYLVNASMFNFMKDILPQIRY